jgi:hypothetical protein
MPGALRSQPVARVAQRLVKRAGGRLLLVDPPNRTPRNRCRGGGGGRAGTRGSCATLQRSLAPSLGRADCWVAEGGVGTVPGAPPAGSTPSPPPTLYPPPPQGAVSGAAVRSLWRFCGGGVRGAVRARRACWLAAAAVPGAAAHAARRHGRAQAAIGSSGLPVGPPCCSPPRCLLICSHAAAALGWQARLACAWTTKTKY